MEKFHGFSRSRLDFDLIAGNVASCAQYRDVLVVNEYQVDKVLKGTYAPKTIRAGQWGLDLRPTQLAAQKPGTSVKLGRETFSDHDELVPELISDTLDEDSTWTITPI